MSCSPPNNCPPAEDGEDCVSPLKRFKKSECFSFKDLIINAICTIRDIAAAIREYTETVKEKGYASALIQFRKSAQTYADNTVYNEIFSRSPLNYKVTGFGVSCLTFPNSGGSYTNDDILTIRLWDFTSNAQIGSNLTLSKTQLQDKQTNEGIPIGTNIFPGHEYGIKITKASTDEATLAMSAIDVYIHVEPVELVVTTP